MAPKGHNVDSHGIMHENYWRLTTIDNLSITIIFLKVQMLLGLNNIMSVSYFDVFKCIKVSQDIHIAMIILQQQTTYCKAHKDFNQHIVQSTTYDQ